MTFYTADELLVEDETAKDLRAIRANVGWGLRGHCPHVRDEFLTRGGRTSALTLFSHLGFEAWRFTPKTFNSITYQVRPAGEFGAMAHTHRSLVFCRRPWTRC